MFREKIKKYSNKLRGFTLAEVLITLAIIGIVAALTIPTLINNIQDTQLNASARKAFSVVSNAYIKAVNEKGSGYGAYSNNTPLSYTKFNAIKSQLNVIRECPFGSGILGKCWAPSAVGTTANPVGCVRWGTANQNTNYAFVTADGMFWMLYTYDATNGADWIAIDTNGAKGPNDWGKDIFSFFMNDTSITPIACLTLTHNDGTLVTNQDNNPLH